MFKYTGFRRDDRLAYRREHPVSMVYRARLPRDLDERLKALCADARLPISACIRLCVQFVLDHPEAWHIFAPPYAQVDTRSPEEQRAYADYERAMERFDMATIAATILRDSGLT